MMLADWLDRIRWNEDGLVPVVTQETGSGRVLTVAWANREALARSLEAGEAHYWSRSRGKLWRKGEESGHVQKLRSIRTDCDQDAVLFAAEQDGGLACHTGRPSCFFRELRDGRWTETDPVLKDPQSIYKK